MYGLQILNPDENFDELFDSLVVIAEYSYPGGVLFSTAYNSPATYFHPYNISSSDFVFARPTSTTPNGFIMGAGDWDADNNHYPKYICCTSGSGQNTMVEPFKVIVARPSKTLTRSISDYGLEVRDANNKVVFNSNEIYLNFKENGKAYGSTATSQSAACGPKTYASMDAFFRSHHYVSGPDYFGDSWHFNLAPKFYTSTITFTPNNAVRYSGLAYPEDFWGHWMTIDLT